ncbi:oxalate decarboxylase family bicupin [uncultured Enterovirga sp.]|uniref:oxalate decarboxylase family bicupin n=1 Tax=uncultured Enterovirga sp. TaxID=2026352 RepID=UPI0035CB564D
MSMSRRHVIAASGLVLASEAAAQTSPAQQSPPEPIAGSRGARDLGPRDAIRDRENPDILTPPKTDRGSIPNLRWSFADSHNRLTNAGWARETTIRELPISKEIAGVNMRLNKGGVRELHWHKEAEWAFMLAGKARITAVDQAGQNFVGEVGPGDLWYFPSGIPHSIQGLEPEGCEFLLAFADGGFSENSTFLISNWFLTLPKEVLAKNFGVPASTFDKIPQKELYIFDAPLPGALDADRIKGPAGSRADFTFRMSAMEPTFSNKSGSVRVVDSKNFPISNDMAAALVEVLPGQIRELHWHPNTDEWQYYLEGQGRMTVFGSGTNAITFDYRAGDVGYVPLTMGHYIENTGTTPLRFLEMFRSNHYEDVSLKQWMAMLPPTLVAAHLNIDKAVLEKLPKDKQLVTGPNVT